MWGGGRQCFAACTDQTFAGLGVLLDGGCSDIPRFRIPIFDPSAMPSSRWDKGQQYSVAIS